METVTDHVEEEAQPLKTTEGYSDENHSFVTTGDISISPTKLNFEYFIKAGKDAGEEALKAFKWTIWAITVIALSIILAALSVAVVTRK